MLEGCAWLLNPFFSHKTAKGSMLVNYKKSVSNIILYIYFSKIKKVVYCV